MSTVICHESWPYMFLGANSNSGWLYFLASSRSITAWSVEIGEIGGSTGGYKGGSKGYWRLDR